MINDKWKIWTGNNIGDSGARMIGESLKTNTTLTKLNLRCELQKNEVKNEINNTINNE